MLCCLLCCVGSRLAVAPVCTTTRHALALVEYVNTSNQAQPLLLTAPSVPLP